MVMLSLKTQSKFLVFGIIFVNCKVSQKLGKQKCYDSLGCITLTPEWTHPLYRPYNLLPSDRHAINTIFVLWTIQDSRLSCEIIGTNSLNRTKINSYLKLLIHDFTSNGYSGWIQHLARTMLSYPNNMQSIISVDWAAGAEPPYTQAIANARLVALEIVHFLHKLMNIFKMKMENVHIVGHGVGAHIAGYVGKIIPPKRITALDPSGTFFERMPPNVHLYREDAEYIEVLHTDASSSGQGNSELLGHADFFANGGRKQPACEDSFKFLKNIKRGDLKLGESLRGCSHKRSLKYFIESIMNQSCAFLGIACESFKNFLEGRCTSCGDDMEYCVRLNTRNPPRPLNSMPGYYFVTSSSPPFCGEMLKIILCIERAAPDQMYVNGYFNVTITQSIGDVNFLINENSIIAALRTNKQHTFLVFRSTPPLLVAPIKYIFLKWHHKPLPCYWCTPPRITKFMIYKITDISIDEAYRDISCGKYLTLLQNFSSFHLISYALRELCLYPDFSSITLEGAIKTRPQWFCTVNATYTDLSFGRQLQPCRGHTKNCVHT